MEMGKDILAIAPDGVPCAFQLKDVGGKQMTLSKWRADLERQLVALVHNQIVHPSISTQKPHRSFIVLNGELSEEVARSIDDFNRGFKGRPKLKAIVRGQLLAKFKKLGSDFWPSEISVEFKLLLELLLTNGRENLPKAKFAELLESSLQLNAKLAKSSSASRARRLAGTAILCSYALAPFQKKTTTLLSLRRGRCCSPVCWRSLKNTSFQGKLGPDRKFGVHIDFQLVGATL